MITATIGRAALAACLALPLAALCLPAPASAQQGARMLAMHAQPATPAQRAQATAALPSAPDRVLTFVRPREADPAASLFLQDNVAIRYTGVPQRHRLVVFLAGTFARPVGYMQFLDTAAKAGFDVIGLEYVDAATNGGPSTIMRICGRSDDPDCAGQIRAARALGGDTASGEHVAPADSIVTRLSSLLAFLARTQPRAGWSDYLASGTPDWSRIVLAGHSQGAGMAAYLAHRFAVARVALLSGGPDGNPRTRQLAGWVKAPSATPADRYYAMVDADEPQEQALLAGLQAIGLAGPATPWTQPAAMGASHIAVVDGTPRQGGAHESTASDLATPLAGAGPAYAPVWNFLLGG